MAEPLVLCVVTKIYTGGNLLTLAKGENEWVFGECAVT